MVIKPTLLKTKTIPCVKKTVETEPPLPQSFKCALQWSFFCGNSQRIKGVCYFRKRAPSQMFDRVLILNAQ